MGDESKKPLTVKQKRFVDAYLGEANGSGVKAARLAGYKGSDNTLHNVASENLRKPKIREMVDKIAASDPLLMTRDERLQILAKIIRAEGVESTKDRLKALDQLSKISGDYIQRVEVSGPDGSAIKSEARIDLAGLDDAALETLIQATKKG